MSNQAECQWREHQSRGGSFDEVWSAMPSGFAGRLFSCLDRRDQLHLMQTSSRVAIDSKRDELWELVALERFRLRSGDQHSAGWWHVCARLYYALDDSTALCTYVQQQNAFSLGYINRDIKERIQHQLLSMVELTANGRDVGSRRQLLDLHVIKCLLRLLSSNIMGICDLVCGALANLICIQDNPHISSCLGNDNADNLKLQMRQLVEQSRGDRALRDMLLSPQVCESGPGPTKHAARVLLNLAFHYDQVLCHVVDIWEGYISSKPSHLTIDNDLCFQQPQGSTSKWHIMYRHGSGRAYLDTTIVDLTLSKRGDTMQGTGSTTKPQASLTLHGQMHSRPGIHNCEFHIAFDNRGRPYGPLPIAHIGYWSSMHADKMWGVWEVGSSPDQFKLGTGGVFLMKKVSL